MIKIFSDIFIFNGFNRSLIVDTSRINIYFISNEWADSIMKYYFSSEVIPDSRGLKELEEFLIKNELAFYVPSVIANNFTPIQMTHTTPYLLNKIIIELSEENKETFIDNFSENKWGYVKYYELFFSENDYMIETIKKINDINQGNTPSIFKIYIPLSAKKIIKENNLDKVNLFLYQYYDNINKKDNLIFEEFINYPLFRNTLYQIIDSIGKNTFCYKTIYISKKGLMAAHPVTLEESPYHLSAYQHRSDYDKLIEDKNFNFPWFISKENIEICNLCELRRICVDNRLPRKKDDVFFYEKECPYNPIISKWEGDNGYLKLKECGEYLSNGKYKISNSE